MVFTRLAQDFDTPILSVSIDEQTGRAGLQTRLEALIDLAWSRHDRITQQKELDPLCCTKG